MYSEDKNMLHTQAHRKKRRKNREKKETTDTKRFLRVSNYEPFLRFNKLTCVHYLKILYNTYAEIPAQVKAAENVSCTFLNNFFL